MDPKPLLLGATTVVILSAMFIATLLICLKKRTPNLPTPKSNSKNLQLPPRNPTIRESISFHPDLSLHQISIAELIDATHNFDSSNIVGEGGFGSVYRARLKTNRTVAVKKLSPDAFQGLREFKAEMETIAGIRHRNLVMILGYCISGDDRLLIYEFIENGSLHRWLHEVDDVKRLDWITRIKIIKGVASGLSFLHHECEPQIIHRDIKSSNVLLDSDFEARIADFGYARALDSEGSHVSTEPGGTVGYMAPECLLDGTAPLTARVDVYGFGVLVLEVLTALMPYFTVDVGGGGELGLVDWVNGMVGEGREVEILETCLQEELGEGKVDPKVVKEILKIASFCCREDPMDRPSMKDVVSMLHGS